MIHTDDIFPTKFSVWLVYLVWFLGSCYRNISEEKKGGWWMPGKRFPDILILTHRALKWRCLAWWFGLGQELGLVSPAAEVQITWETSLFGLWKEKGDFSSPHFLLSCQAWLVTCTMAVSNISCLMKGKFYIQTRCWLNVWFVAVKTKEWAKSGKSLARLVWILSGTSTPVGEMLLRRVCSLLGKQKRIKRLSLLNSVFRTWNPPNFVSQSHRMAQKDIHMLPRTFFFLCCIDKSIYVWCLLYLKGSKWFIMMNLFSNV